MERTGLVTFQGNPLTLLGNPITAGDKVPDVAVLDNTLQERSLSEWKDKVVILISVPSLDTDVCSLEAKRFNDEAKKLDDQVAILTVSMDLPFAQKRWQEAEGAGELNIFSDHRDAAFGEAFGVLIKELRLLARAVFVVDQKGMVTYAQIVDEVTHEPDYTGALEAARKAL
ncbi:Redoxin domain protein [Desulfovibrio sp. X2]|uniref:thiol peroxidase n=1 Tax=Desulfovibrio sp. X2 TaxID=941449 RepID=UPI000358B12D|nr:thiol peroxidase [Desulfovibrio sp. X2]EPR43642.1 Redoxin domain protein [Desulfovibrio sp. X2]